MIKSVFDPDWHAFFVDGSSPGWRIAEGGK